MNSSNYPDPEEPNLRALFYAGPLDGMEIWFPKAYSEFRPIIPVKDLEGHVLKRQVVTYRLESAGPPLLYRFVSAKDHTEPESA